VAAKEAGIKEVSQSLPGCVVQFLHGDG